MTQHGNQHPNNDRGGVKFWRGSNSHHDQLLAERFHSCTELSNVRSIKTINAIGPQYSHLFHRKEQNTAQTLRQPLRSIAIRPLIKRFYTPTLHNLPLRAAAEKSCLVHTPRGNIIQRAAHIEIPMFTNVTVVQSAIQNFVMVVDMTIDVINRIAEFVPDNNLTFPLLALFHQIDNNNRTAVPLQQILKMSLRRLIRRIHPIQHNGRFGHRHTTFLRPKRGYRPPNL
mmetsp:Transcript_39458/g.71027  ORF Transcript_39458/g.71027 Transcript_39458/m.71027 type:complete len:227 (-) Transcript_39458:136-816(-)